MRQDLVVPHLVDYLLEVCGVKPSDLTIVIANGTHIGGNEQELRTLVTDGVYDRIRVENHDCEAKDLVYLGTTPHKNAGVDQPHRGGGRPCSLPWRGLPIM